MYLSTFHEYSTIFVKLLRQLGMKHVLLINPPLTSLNKLNLHSSLATQITRNSFWTFFQILAIDYS